MGLSLGRLPSIRDKRNLYLAKYLQPDKMPSPPLTVEWQKPMLSSGWGMMGNDLLGNCVVCTAAHIIDAAQANESGELVPIPDADVIQLSYTMGAVNGFTILERLKWWKKYGLFGTKIEGYAEVDHENLYLIRSVIHSFGHADIGLWMPEAWKLNPRYWHIGKGPTYRPGSWGGHSVCLIGYRPGPEGLVYQAISWGEVIDITQSALEQYMDEAWVSVVSAWYEKDALTPSGFDVEQLKKDLAEIE